MASSADTLVAPESNHETQKLHNVYGKWLIVGHVRLIKMQIISRSGNLFGAVYRRVGIRSIRSAGQPRHQRFPSRVPAINQRSVATPPLDPIAGRSGSRALTNFYGLFPGSRRPREKNAKDRTKRCGG